MIKVVSVASFAGEQLKSIQTIIGWMLETVRSMSISDTEILLNKHYSGNWAAYSSMIQRISSTRRELLLLEGELVSIHGMLRDVAESEGVLHKGTPQFAHFMYLATELNTLKQSSLGVCKEKAPAIRASA